MTYLDTLQHAARLTLDAAWLPAKAPIHGSLVRSAQLVKNAWKKASMTKRKSKEERKGKKAEERLHDQKMQ